MSYLSDPKNLVRARVVAGELEVDEDGDGLDLLQAVYHSPDQPLHTRMRAAALALPFERPKLAALAVYRDGGDFADRLEAATKRSRAVQRQPLTLEAQALPAGPEPVAAQPERNPSVLQDMSIDRFRRRL